MKLGYPLLCALAGALLFYLLTPSPPEPDYARVIVHREAIERLEPDTVVRWRERIRWLTPTPTRVAIAPGAAVGLVGAFCAPTVLRVQGDTAGAAEEPRTLLLRSGSLDTGWLWRSDELRLTGPTSDGDLVQGTWRVRGDASWRVVGDSVLVRADRWWWAKEGGEALFWGGLGYFAGRLF